jgi:hypothetical protein
MTSRGGELSSARRRQPQNNMADGRDRFQAEKVGRGFADLHRENTLFARKKITVVE